MSGRFKENDALETFEPIDCETPHRDNIESGDSPQKPGEPIGAQGRKR